MSDDLISRSALSKEICNKECNVPEFETERELNAFLLGLNVKQIKVMECLSDMPAVYDVDKVVERLEKDSREIALIILKTAFKVAIESVKKKREYLHEIFISKFVKHDLKILPDFFEEVESGKKKFELRKNDRDYKVHDIFILREWEPGKGYTGRYYINEISYILKDCPEYGLMDGYVIFGW